MKLQNLKLAVVGLGYVGLPLAIEFGKHRPVIGFDIDQKRICELEAGKDVTLEVSEAELRAAKHLAFTTSPDLIASASCYIVAVPTPILKDKRPDLSLLTKASEMIGKLLSPGDIVIYESTVYPGCTEEDCVPILERYSGLKYMSSSKDDGAECEADVFYCGYSPERINPGDKEHRLVDIKKVTSGSTPKVADLVDSLYGSIITAGTHKAPSIKVAEAAKVIENTQRDINIALVNELAIIFDKMEIDTQAVLEAAGTKWNFLAFRPGLVGGHCIGVDPYYLTYKSESLGYHPRIILAGRHLNDDMGVYIVLNLIKAMITKSIKIEGARVLIMGLSFKENCPDMRNTRVVDLVRELEGYRCCVDVYDPWVDKGLAQSELGLLPIEQPAHGKYDAVLIAVAHDQFYSIGPEGFRAFLKQSDEGVIYDLKYVLGRSDSDLRL